MNSGILFLVVSCLCLFLGLRPTTTFRKRNIRDHTLLVLSCECFILFSLAAFWDTQLVFAWQWALVLLSVYIYILFVLHQLRKITSVPKTERPGLLGKKIHPVYVFLLFLWGAVVPLVLPLLWSAAVSQVGTIVFALAMASLFASWLFMDNEKETSRAIDRSLFKTWLAICGAFAALTALVEEFASKPHWHLCVISLAAFAGVSRMAISLWSAETWQEGKGGPALTTNSGQSP